VEEWRSGGRGSDDCDRALMGGRVLRFKFQASGGDGKELEVEAWDVGVQ
jgi:hypothetical protein